VTSGDVHTLTGAYALDALSEIERAAFERHLADCVACRQEVDELRATAARLGSAVAVAPPAGMRDSVLAEIGRTRQLPPRGEATSRRRVSWPLRIALVATAAAAGVAVVLGVRVAGLEQRLDAAQQQAASVNAVLAAPDATPLRDAGTAVVVSRGQGRAVVVAAGLPELDAAHVYQLWVIGPGGPRSAGLLGAGTADRIRPLIAEVPTDANRIGITVEPAGGSAAPTTPAVTMLTL
jgi:anti-sigma-K factor RskA